MEAFRYALTSLRISPSSSVGVAISGGSDSVALAFLANQFFKHVVGITVDHQLRPESRQEALQVKSMMESLGLQHQLLTLEWPNGCKPALGKIQTVCRERRYHALLNECRKRELGLLLVGHHADDLIETFFYRLFMSSGIIGLSSILPLVHLPKFPEIPVIRPLLAVRKEALKEVCTGNHLKWIEDPSNTNPVFWRNSIRQALADYPPDFHEGVLGIIKTCSEARLKIDKEVSDVLSKMIRINNTHGYITVKYSMFNRLSPPVGRRVLDTLIKFLRGEEDARLSLSALRNLHSTLSKRSKTTQNYGGCFVFHHSDQEFGVAREYVPRELHTFTPIRVGETVHWDNRFDISLHGLNESHQSDTHEIFCIRHMVKKDFPLASKGIRKVKSVKLAPVPTRGGLPVIVAKKEGVDKYKWPAVLVPHFKFIDREYGIKCQCSFRPSYPFSSYLSTTSGGVDSV